MRKLRKIYLQSISSKSSKRIPTNLNFTSGVLLTSVPDVFFVEEQSQVGQVSQLTALAYFWGVKLMFVGIMNFGHIPTLKFVGVKIFQSKSNPNLVVLNRSSELASFKTLKIMTGFKLATDY